MSTQQLLATRSGHVCELCKGTAGLSGFVVEGGSDLGADASVLLCGQCMAQVSGGVEKDTHHFMCLNESMWSQIPAVQVLAWRLLNELSSESWAQSALDMLYLDDELMAWAKTGLADESTEATLDSNGVALQSGDTVTLIKDLDVKGAGFTAKRGTLVRGISLTDNPKHIEGKVNGTRIVLIAAFLKKA
jgi:protein PhnA